MEDDTAAIVPVDIRSAKRDYETFKNMNADEESDMKLLSDIGNSNHQTRVFTRKRLTQINQGHDHGMSSSNNPYNEQYSPSDELINVVADYNNDEENILEELNRLPPVQPIGLSFSRKVAIASGHILNDLCASLWFSYLLLYFQKVVEFDKTSSNNDSRYAAGLMFLGQIIDGIATPLVGYEADQDDTNCWLCRRSYGRCKSWHLVGVVLVIISFPFVFAPCIGCNSESGDAAKLIYYAPFIVIFQIGWASTQISHLALIPKMHPDELVRTELLAMRYGFTVGANIIVFLMTWFTLGNNDDCRITPADADNFMKIALLAVGIGSFFAILFHIYVKEESDQKIKLTVAVLNTRKELIRRLSQVSHISHVEEEFVQSSLPNTNSSTEGYRHCSRIRSKSTSGSETAISRRGNVFHTLENVSEDESRRPLLPQDEIENILVINSSFKSTVIIEETRISRLSTRYLSLGKDHMKIKDWLILPQFYLVALVYLSTRMSINLSQIYVPLYLQDSLKLPCRTVATVPLTMYLSGFIVSLFIKSINKHFGRQLSYLFGAVLLLAGSLLVFFLNWDGPNTIILKGYVIYFAASLLGGGASAILVTSLSITADLIGNNVENGALIYGAMSFCDKVGCGLGVLAISSLVPCSDEENISIDDIDPCDKNDNIPFYRDVLAFSAGGCAIVGVFGVLLLTIQIHLQNRQRSRQ